MQEPERIAFAEQELPGYSLSAPPSTVDRGSDITVTFAAPAGHSANDWVGIFPVGGQIYQYIDWSFVGGATSGTVTVTLPESATEGQQYELRYILADYTPAATSSAFTATTAVSPYQFPNGPYTSPPGRPFWVDWDAPANHNTRDWIGLYRVGGTQYLGYAFVGDAGLTSGSLQLTMPANAVPGDAFEVRWMLASGRMANRSAPFSAGSGVTGPTGYVAADTDIVAAWTAPSNHAGNDWIGVVPADGLSTDYVAWSVVGAIGSTSGNTTIHLPVGLADGSYELRYFLAGTYEISGISDTFNVGSAPGVSGPASATPGSTISASWQAPLAHSANDWIGLYKVGAPSWQLAAYAYVGSAGQTTGTVSITVPANASGTYELRYATNNSYNVTATSASFPVN